MRRPTRIAIAAALLVALIALALLFWRGPWSFHPFAREAFLQVRWARSGPFQEGCITCHQGATPHRTGILEKHPSSSFGCTSCHGGDASSTTKSAHEGLRSPEIEAGCGTCHTRADVEGMPLLSEGRALFRELRCAACHTTGRDDAPRGPASPIAELAAKTTPEHALRFLRAPRAAVPRGVMPSFWPPPVDATKRAPLGEETTGHKAWQTRMKTETASLVAYLFAESEKSGLPDEIARRANVTGSSADEGKRLYDAIGCAACHEASAGGRAPAPSLADAGDRLREDWLAWFLEDPARAHDRTPMPSMRLDRRASASLAKFLALNRDGRAREPIDPAEVDPARRTDRVLCSVGDPHKEMSRAECGELLFGFYGCGSCHAPRARAPVTHTVEVSLVGYADRAPKEGTWRAYTEGVLATPRVFGVATRKMPAYELSPAEARALVVYLASTSARAPSEPYDPSMIAPRAARTRGREALRDLSCGACHGPGARLPANMAPPSLDAEGERARASWLAAFLRDPGANGIRPWLHPEWVWGSLVPPERLAPRMPTFTLEPAEIDAMVSALGAGEGETPRPASSSDWMRSRQRLRTCASCHYRGELPVERAKTSLEKLAPDLDGISGRRRPEWVRAMLSAPSSADAGAPPAHAPLPTVEAEAITSLLFAKTAGASPP